MSESEFNFDWSFFVLVELLESLKREPNQVRTCLDIGSGSGVHTQVLRAAGFTVTQLDKYSPTAELQEGFLESNFNDRFDYVFCSHVIEHQRNCGLFLDKIYDVLKDDGRLVLSAPKHPATRIIEGHINSFVFPLLLQQLVYAGFDCNLGKFMSCSGIENSVIVPKARNYSLSEREHDAHKWSDAHRARSFVELKAQDFKDHTFFRNCVAWSADPDGKMRLKIDPNEVYGLRLISDRWNLEVSL